MTVWCSAVTFSDASSHHIPRNLALFTGVPAFREKVPVGRPNVVGTDAVMTRIRGALDRKWLTNEGPLVQELEAAVADELGVANCVATANATVAIELLLHTLGLSGDVIVPSWTFVADAHALTWTGLNPVFVDVDAHTHCLDPARIEDAITEATTAILAVHLWGNGCDVAALADIAHRHDLELVYDAAHAFACSIDGAQIGRFGRAEVFSFHATKMVNSFEGGAITTDDDDLAAALRLARNFGFDGEDQVVMAGTNAKMSEPCAAMGITSLESLDLFLERNHENHHAYRSVIEGVPGVSVNLAATDDATNRHYVVTEVDAVEAGLSRDELVAALRYDLVEARRYFAPGCHRQRPYSDTHRGVGVELPVTEALSERVMTLPTGLAVRPEDAALIAGMIALAVDRAADVRRALADGQAPGTAFGK